ncbi:uncharacterized protein BJ212DRAFT_1296857 [Suillus subaureus]|uniref:Uncharacterized protein n=1 Tax=Suillus subaureus TaxID=48587 RepID=A0A9P7EJT8_9AGAM|nr:uncharacterized protein BJ212DRAFT_1296857 [Suillus subaureus]KAG1822926.1 hypothetical protein BJ212DRAFT_1296857 [Suillus subaureus]
MATNNLPVELWHVVFSLTKVLKFSLNDLAALCRVCIGFHHAIVDSLYECITVDNSDVCTTLAEHPHLAEKVKSFIFTYPTTMGYDSPEDNIRDLAITGEPRHRDTYSEFPGILSPTSLPHLTEISGSISLLHALVPGRPVQTVWFKGCHVQSAKWGLDEIVGHSTVPVRNLGLDLTIWPLSVLYNPRGLLPNHVEEITLTGFATGRPFISGEHGMSHWIYDVHRILGSTPSLKRLTFWMEGEREDACGWAQLLFQEFHDELSRLEQVSCVIAGPDMSTSFDFFDDKSGCLLTGPREDNQTRSHRAVNDIRELMPLPILCCSMGEKGHCDRKTFMFLQLDRREMEGWMRMMGKYPELPRPCYFTFWCNGYAGGSLTMLHPEAMVLV